MYWLADCTEPTGDTNPISVRELYGDYTKWCESAGKRKHSFEVFAASLDEVRQQPELARTIRKFGNRYYGLRLVDARALRQIESASGA
jgi:hypothetical protein